MQKKIENTILLVILVIFLLYFLLNYNLSQAIKDLGKINLTYIPYIVLAWLMFTSLKFLPWELTLKKVKVKMPLIKSFLFMYAFFGLGMGSAGVGQLIPLRKLDKFKKDARFFSVSIMLFLGTTGSMAAILLALISSVLLSKFILYLLFIFALGYIFITILGFESPYKKLVSVINNRKRIRTSKMVKRGLKYIEGMRKQRGLMAQRYFISGMLLFIPSLISEALLLVFILAAFNVNISILTGIFIFTVSVTIGGLSMLPAGIGTEDISLVALMVLFNVPGVLALASLIIFRLFNTFLVTIAGYLTIGFINLDKKIKKI
ncbi:MAG: lysylphosphatidylglycerol synthase transmembrane domain-containing protein [Candidatus Parvarchaeum sp.]